MVYNMDFDFYKTIIRKNLDDYRYNHSLCVADEAKRLAIRYGADQDSAYLAGLLHDITKNFSDEEHLNIFCKFDIILSNVEMNSNKLWHSISGSAYVKNILKIDNQEIVSSIRYHTTAKSNMTLFEKLIYIADFTSSDRTYPDVDIMRNLADISLDEAMKYSLKYTINDLVSRNKTVHPDTLNAYNEIIIKTEN